MGIEATLARIAAIEARIDALTNARPTAAAATSFAALLRGNLEAPGATATAAASGSVGLRAPVSASAVGGRMLALARAELGVREAPPGSNDGPRIALYRSAVPGGPVGPWCAYFVSWLARQAGAPLGDRGQGFASVDALWSWARAAGRTYGPEEVPRPGDLVVWDEHIGIVERVLPDGRIQTIEGNTSDSVARRVHDAAGVIGYVRM
ncbi:CHAP domain-containing protein [Thermoleophilum album]|uniref:CHAP domain-containing protein n=1 Tax=Thermoleophilum album TaxID=29539 RepID=A0A1H6FWB1_THEAL|nr:CHAP domain-containing protein [Thermoleophilum album]SEH14590.1 CHAP domain-containing protein [Thermoleophilum album]